MSRTVKVPDPIYQELAEIAEREDISRGEIIRGWRRDAKRYRQQYDEESVDR